MGRKRKTKPFKRKEGEHPLIEAIREKNWAKRNGFNTVFLEKKIEQEAKKSLAIMDKAGGIDRIANLKLDIEERDKEDT